MNLYWAGAASFAFFMLLGIFGGKLFHFEGPTYYFFLGIMGALGLGSYAIFAYFQNRAAARKEAKGNSAAPGQAAAGGNAEVDHLIREANARLAQSRGGVSIANFPMIFVAGDRGTAKTSSILNSGLEPELLAGQIYQENIVASTRTANLFFARDTVFVEAGGALMAQPGNWKALVSKLQPARLKSTLGGGSQAPRGVVLCFDLEAFTRPGAADSIGNAARYLQERLGEISQVLGISFPVYVLFTRADRLPFFADFVRNLAHEEAGQVVGATLPIRPPAAGGVYAEEETRRLSEAFNLLFHSFCDQRLRLLPRESDAERVPGAYEFPREFRKLRNLVVQFLVDIARPSQLRASPFLRGFYFSGVRPVEVRDIAAPAAAPQPQSQPQELSGATGMFRAGMQAERRAQQAMAAPSGAARKVPQWLFLGHLFNDVILADGAARAASGSSIKTSLTKRILLASAAGLCLLYSIMLIVSYFGNSSLQSTALTAARAMSAPDTANGGLPNEDSLRRLETLRQSLAKLTDYKTSGAPFSLRWGLYSGNDILPHVRRLYYARFRLLLFGATQNQMLAYLQSRPAQPGPTDDYGYPYDTLKAYLLTTSEWKRDSDPGLQSFLGSRLLNRWSNGHDADIGQARMDLAKLQFDFYAKDLANDNPYSVSSEPSALDKARRYLAGFPGIQRVYAGLLADADKVKPPTTFNKEFPGTGDVLTSGVEVRWAFTRDGWKFIDDRIKKQSFGGEAWVLGNYQGQMPDQTSLAASLRAQYTKDYIEQWRRVLRGSRVNAYANLRDAATKLTRLSSSDTPLLALFWWASQNTTPDPSIASKFDAVHKVVPPSDVRQFVVPPNQNYANGLLNLRSAVDQAANQPPGSGGDPAWLSMATAADNNAVQLSQTFVQDPEARIDQAALELLRQPITNLNQIGPDFKGAGVGLCADFNRITLNRFPFDPARHASGLFSPDASLTELNDFLRPKTGKLWTVYESSLKNAMQCQNGDCKPTSPKINPAFVDSIGRLMKFSQALYGDSGTEPNMHYSLRAEPSGLITQFTVAINGQASKLSTTATQPFLWPGPGPRGFRLQLSIGAVNQDVEPFDGDWAVFHFFADAETVHASPGGNIFGWVQRSGLGGSVVQINGKDVAWQLFVDSNVFSKNFLSTLKCVAPVTR